MSIRHAKIVATVGPASAAPSMLDLLHRAGVNAFRLNFSHGTHEAHAKVVEAVRRVQARHGSPIALIADLQGPKLRVGAIKGEALSLVAGAKLRIEASHDLSEPGFLRLPHPELIEAADPGSSIKLDDGKFEIRITGRDKTGLTGEVVFGGTLKERKGVNLVGRPLPISALTEKDKADLAFALDQGVDYIALSFVQRAADVHEARALIGDRASLIVKIEKPSAVDDLAEITEAADAVMVARGDLGVELSTEMVPIVQRRIIRTARAAGKPVIVATHMLESMIEAASPTRAEASDVANAIYQGADAVMLSAESAVGRHPASAVAIMDRLIRAVEDDPEHWDQLGRTIAMPEETTADAISLAARRCAEVLNCKTVVAFTRTGSTAYRIARVRPPCTIVGLTDRPEIARRLALVWGVRPVEMEDVHSFDEMVQTAQAVAVNYAEAVSGDRIVITAGIPFGRPGKTDTLKISKLPQIDDPLWKALEAFGKKAP